MPRGVPIPRNDGAEERVMTIPEVARILLISEARAYEYARQGTFPAFNLGRRVRVPRKQFFAWLDRQGQVTP